MNKERILIINYEFPPLGGGGGVATQLIAEGYQKSNCLVDVVTTHLHGLPWKDEQRGINVYRVPVMGRKELSTASLLSLITFPISSFLVLLFLMSTRKYLLIHSFFAVPSGISGIFFSKLFSVRHILTILGGDIYDPTKSNSPHKSRVMRNVVAYVLKQTEYIVADSLDIAQRARDIYAKELQISIITIPYKPSVIHKKRRKDLGLSTKNKYCISVGRLVKRKGFSELIQAFKYLPLNYHLLLIGEGPELHELKKTASDLNIDERVHFLGRLSEENKFSFLDVADLFVLPSIHEGFGIVLQEAMQVGLPIVSTVNGGQRDAIFNYPNVLFIKNNNPRTISVAIKKMIASSKIESEVYLSAISPITIANKYLSLIAT